MSLSAALAELHTQSAPHIAAWRRLPAREATFAPMPNALAAPLRDGLRQRGVSGLYTHQAHAVEAALGGEHVCVVTPTASGKTLCYVLPTLQALLADPSARALYIFPTKALAQDQLTELGRWQAVLGLPLGAATYDGDTPTSARSRIRRSARVLVTNPDMLHTGILPHHTGWAELFEGLRLVVIDEMHTYRGVFGSHVANVLRRLRRIADFYGARPQFILCSATIANPAELAEGLVEAPVRVIDEDGAPRGERNLICLNPPIVDHKLGIRRGAANEATLLARRFLAHDVQTAVFAGSRLATEVILHNLKRNVDRPLSAYRSGYLPAERRAVEAGLREGALRGVVATNALELGVDIGGLDAVILAGYPGTIASAWQQAGRAGRRGSPSAAVLVAGGGPLDQYIMAHPDYLWGEGGRPVTPERALINPDNALILAAHLRCAAFEAPFGLDEAFGGRSGETGRVELTQDVLAFLAAEGELHRSSGAWRWLAEGYPAERVGLRTASPERVVITTSDDLTPSPSPGRRGEPEGNDLTPNPSPGRRGGPEGNDLTPNPSPTRRGGPEGGDLTPSPSPTKRGGPEGGDLTPNPSPGRRGGPEGSDLTPSPSPGRRGGPEGSDLTPSPSPTKRGGPEGEVSSLLPPPFPSREPVRYAQGWWGGRGVRSSGVIGEVDRASAPLFVYPGAVYLHAGAMYHVDRLDWDAGVAYARPVDVEFYTDASASVDIQIVATSAEADAAGAVVAHGEVEVTTKATGFRQVRFTTGETLGWGEIDLPAQTMLTTAYWLQLTEATVERLREEGWWRFDPNDYGPTWAAQRDKARERDGYRCRNCGAPERQGRQHDVHHLQPFRSFGYARGKNRHDEIANRVENLVTLCQACHRRAEERQRMRGALSGLATVVANLAPLYLMCDPRDLGVLSESKAVGTGQPTLTVYERTPAGLGFAAALYDLHARLMADARALIAACPCPHGCPGCIGPTTEADPQAKAWTLRLLEELTP